jgi:predicted metalloprotease
VDIAGRRRSGNFEDRGRGDRGGGGLSVNALASLVRLLGVKGTAVVGLLAAGVFFLAPGDFAQAYVIAHEVGHHVQNLIGAASMRPAGETRNQVSVRMELQADCLAGVWGRSAKAALDIDDADLKEALNAAHSIGDDALGQSQASDYTHGSSAQRIRWFRRGFDSGDPRQCDTFAVKKHSEL